MKCTLTVSEDRKDVNFRVIDGGALLHRIQNWPKSCTYLELYKYHVQSVRKMYGQCTIVFDGYKHSSTKDHEHKRRSGKVSTVEITLKDESMAHCRREDFLSNSKNKTQLIAMLRKHLLKDHQTVVRCKSDADTQIVKEAIKVRIGGFEIVNSCSVIVQCLGQNCDLKMHKPIALYSSAEEFGHLFNKEEI